MLIFVAELPTYHTWSDN